MMGVVHACEGDEVVPHKHSDRSYHALRVAGFENVALKTFQGLCYLIRLVDV